jgi:hypothetical protein
MICKHLKKDLTLNKDKFVDLVQNLKVDRKNAPSLKSKWKFCDMFLKFDSPHLPPPPKKKNP